jgi:hypothetical protein
MLALGAEPTAMVQLCTVYPVAVPVVHRTPSA